jgi:Fe(3+) dicitrate transport protein
LEVKSNNRHYRASGVQLALEQSFLGERVEHHIEAGVRLHADLVDRFQYTDKYRMDDGAMLLTTAGIPGTESNRVGTAEALASHVLYRMKVGRFTLHPGLRHERITLRQDDYGRNDPGRSGSDLQVRSNTVEVWIPGFAMDADLGHGLRAFAGVHRGFSPPGTDPRTRPEHSINKELGLRVERGALDVQLIGFHNAYSELLGSDMAASGGMGTGDLFNGGRATVYGLECFVAHELLHHREGRLRLPASLSYTWTDARFGSSFNSTFGVWGQVLAGDRIPYIAEHQLNARIAVEDGRHVLAVNVAHMGGMPAQAGPQVDDAFGSVPAFTVVDLAAQRHLGRGITAFATLQNALDQAYMVSFVPAGARPGMPRAITGGMRFIF